ncbi:hypothetical protein L228DRAFT_281036 [Xylona heveae TC161]|uniref:Fungal N-terminal domain-containing protein n=1 Tax=Xylona heveae (strain CBS 132557 / TC161) TaxID=1328760 RepID=A0A165J768_XYLHT|nr:hypothetical protein L228DRAFT_281036 [Xylona heveae TC161]KZF25832.1 hypothetical protein L228DRAFT_281036 [Xylona heveae TC161]
MAGIGEASSIIAVIDLGLKFGKTLQWYVSTAKGAKEEVLLLISDISSTFGHLHQLNELIEKNKKTHCWGDVGVQDARKCVRSCQKIIEKFQKLLKRSSVPVRPENFTQEDIDLSKFGHLSWPLYARKFEKYRQELSMVKLDVLLLHSSYMVSAGSIMEQDRYQRQIADLRREKTSVLGRLAAIKQSQSGPQNQGSSKGTYSNPFAPRLEEPQSFGSHGPYPSRRGDILDLDDPLYPEIQKLIEEKVAQKKMEEEKKAAEKKALQEEVIQNWKDEKMKELDEKAQSIDAEKSKIYNELLRRKVAPETINDIISDLYPPLTLDRHNDSHRRGC